MTDVGLMIKAMRLAWIHCTSSVETCKLELEFSTQFFLKKTRWLKLSTAL